MNRHPGFTLIELLVVVSVIAVLLGLLLPAVSAARESGLDTKCRSNIRQLALAQQRHAEDNGLYATFWSETLPVSWRQKVAHVLQTPEGPADLGSVYHCPNVRPDEIAAQPRDASRGVHAASYGMNGAAQFPQWAYDPEKVPAPSRIILLGEQPVSILEGVLTSDNYGVWAAGEYAGWFGSPEHRSQRGYRHQLREHSNVAFVDGHVEQLGYEPLRRESGHWYWWDALKGDTATQDSDLYIPPIPTPSPRPAPRTSEMPEGPATAPCGC